MKKITDAKGHLLYKGDVLRDDDKFYIVDDPFEGWVLSIEYSPEYKKVSSLGYPKRWIGKGIEYERSKGQ